MIGLAWRRFKLVGCHISLSVTHTYRTYCVPVEVEMNQSSASPKVLYPLFGESACYMFGLSLQVNRCALHRCGFQDFVFIVHRQRLVTVALVCMYLVAQVITQVCRAPTYVCASGGTWGEHDGEHDFRIL